MKVITKVKYIDIIRKFHANEKTRYYLNGIHFEPHPKKGVIMVATNGHIMGAIHDEEGVFESSKKEGFTLPISAQMKRGIKEARAGSLFVYNKNMASIVATMSQDNKENLKSCMTPNKNHTFIEWLDPIDGTFPDWRRVMPKPPFKEVKGNSFNPKYLAMFEIPNYEGATLYQTDEVSPSLVKVSSLPEFVGVLMPMRCQTNDTMPDWTQK